MYIAGIMGTPLGGLAIDYIVKVATNQVEQYHYRVTESNITNNTNIFNRNNSYNEIYFEYEVTPVVPRSVSTAGHVIPPMDPVSQQHIIDRLSMPSIIYFIIICSIVGMSFLCAIYFIVDLRLYILCVTFGCIFVFICNAGINMVIMTAIPIQTRAIGVGCSAIIMHLLGDVPSPIVVGKTSSVG